MATKRTRELVFCENLRCHEYKYNHMIKMVLKPKRFDFETHFGWTQTIKYEPRSNVSQHKTVCINIDDPLFAGARFELKDFNIHVTWPNVEQIGFDDCNLTHIDPGSLKGSDLIKKYLIMIINFYFDYNLKKVLKMLMKSF